jgi:DNA mismatch endonuclease (patch repair protein)
MLLFYRKEFMTLTRSQNMARIRSSNTKPEVKLRRALWNKGLRYRVNYLIEGIKPDLVFTKARLAIFIDGCQWHGCPEHYVRPRTRPEFWGKKLFINVERDVRQTKVLQEAGWHVYRVWEHTVWEHSDILSEEIKVLLEKTEQLNEENWRVFQVDIVDPDTDLERRYMLSLYSPNVTRIVEQIRSTRKWLRKNN